MSWAAATSHLAMPDLVLKPSSFLPAGNHSPFLALLVTSTTLLVAYLVSSAIYALTLHPLTRFPGPRLCAASRIPFWYACITGHQVRWMHALHTRYGPIVRYSPNDLSFVDEGNNHPAGSAWKAIHGQEKGDTEFPKAKEWFVAPENGIYGINSAAPLSSHRRYRRIFRSAFSSSFLRAQEPRFQKHVSALLSVLTSAATTTIPSLAGHSQGVPIDILELLNFTTFDIMGDLTLSQPLGLLASRAYTPWVSAVFASLRVIPLAQVIQHYPVLSALFRLVEPKAVKEMKYRHFRHSADRVDARLARGGEDLNDIWSLVLRSEGSDDALSLEEMYTHADVFMLAGSETTGTAMAGLVYLLLKNPEKMDKVKREVRGAFPDGMGELTMEMAAGRLGYLDACIQEALRMYPPVPVGVPREVPAPGKEIVGRWVAPGTRVSVHHYATYRWPDNFAEPDRFLPERHLAAASDGDRREALQPFGCGPRNCIGQNMAMQEMRLIMACLLLRFDLELCNPEVDWLDQRAFVLWEKHPLMCHVREAVVY